MPQQDVLHDIAAAAADFAVQHYVPSCSVRVKRRWWRKYFDLVLSSLHAYRNTTERQPVEPSAN